MMSKRVPLTVSCILLAIAVILGAFGAHALRDMLTPRQLETWGTGVEYHFYHAMGMLVLSIVYYSRPERWLGLAVILLGLGVLFFSGSLYLLTTMDWSFLGPVTPLGGVFFIGGWLVAIRGLKNALDNAQLR